MFSFENMKASLYGAGSFDCKIRRKRRVLELRCKYLNFRGKARYMGVWPSDLRCDSCYRPATAVEGRVRLSEDKAQRGRVDIRPAPYTIPIEFGSTVH